MEDLSSGTRTFIYYIRVNRFEFDSWVLLKKKIIEIGELINNLMS